MRTLIPISQLLMAGAADTEKIFFFKNSMGFHAGDEEFSTPKTALSRGENCFGYVMLSNGQTVNGEGSIVPILATPLIRGGIDPIFDDLPFGGQAVFLRNDLSAVGAKVDDSGKLTGGKRGLKALFSAPFFTDDTDGKVWLDIKIPR